METSYPTTAALQALAAMAALLERLERAPRAASADQYQKVARLVGRLLSEAEPGDALNALLAMAPATAEIYENQQYAHAGLCRSPLDESLAAEQEAAAAITRSRRAAPTV
jgi:hypothetical protein